MAVSGLDPKTMGYRRSIRIAPTIAGVALTGSEKGTPSPAGILSR